jgi:2-hydroxy-3-keto-5-methylthiopentenyl-1-phosphate phosphatase
LPRRGGVRFCNVQLCHCHADCSPDLVTYCEKEKVPFTTFNDFSDIHNTVKDIVAGKLSVTEAATGRK